MATGTQHTQHTQHTQLSNLLEDIHNCIGYRIQIDLIIKDRGELYEYTTELSIPKDDLIAMLESTLQGEQT